MPLPIIHSFAGYSVYKLSRNSNSGNNWTMFMVCILFGNLADFDFLPGLIMGKAIMFHRECTHSLLAGVVFSLILGTILTFSARKKGFSDANLMKQVIKTSFIPFLAYSTHVLLDMFSGPGVPLLWPFIDENIAYPLSIFTVGSFGGNLIRSAGFNDFFSLIFSPAIVKPLLFECFVVFSVWGLSSFLKDLRYQRRPTQTLSWVRGLQAVVFFIAFNIY